MIPLVPVFGFWLLIACSALALTPTLEESLEVIRKHPEEARRIFQAALASKNPDTGESWGASLAKAYPAAAGMMKGNITKTFALYSDLGAALAPWAKPLTPADKEYWDIVDNSPKIASNCALSPACMHCFKPAYEKLTSARLQLESTRRIYTTGRRKIQAMIRLYVGVLQGLGPLGALKGGTEELKLEAELRKVDDAYDAKVSELTNQVKQALTQLGECERQFHGEEDWYNRFGFIYYQFLSDRYRHAD